MDLYPHLLHAGALPTPQEHASILAAKLTCEDQRTKLAQEIRELQKRLEDAQKRLELLDEQIDAHSRLISPLRRIPPEIMRDIFALAAPLTSSYAHVGIGTVTPDRVLHAPWTTMEVCKHWKELCLMFGSLWSDIAFKTGSFNHERPIPALPGGGIPSEYWPRQGDRDDPYADFRSAAIARSAQILTTQLERSKDADLYVTITMSTSTSAKSYGQPYLRILWPHIHRVAYLNAPAYVLDNTPIPFPLDRIREVHVDYFRPSLDEDEHARRMQNITEQAARVPNFSATVYSGNSDEPGDWQLPANIYRPDMLTRLILRASDGWAQLRPLLSQLENLTDLQLTEAYRLDNFNFMAHQQTDPPALDPIPLTKLSRLSITCLDPSQPAEILTHIVAPNLQHLSCHVPVPIHPVERFLTDSGCRLRTLCIQYRTSRSLVDFLFTCADAISSIHALEVTHHSDIYAEDPRTKEFDANMVGLIEFLSHPCVRGDSGLADSIIFADDVPGTSELVLPHLQILQLQDTQLPAREFIDMLQTRRRPERVGSVRLESCTITDTYSTHKSLSSEELGKEAVKRAREHAIRLDDIIPRDFAHSIASEWPGRRAVQGRVYKQPGIEQQPRVRNRQLPWAEGLEREPEQKRRLGELVEGGLELWM